MRRAIQPALSLLLSLNIVFTLVTPGILRADSQALLLFDPDNPSVSDWKDTWGDLPAGATVKIENKKMVVTGSLSNQSFGCAYRSLEVDLDKTPNLEMQVESASHHWYMILKGDQLPNGYVKVQPDTDETGLIQYDLRLVSGLKGKQTFSEIQLGISTEESASGNKGQTLVIQRMAFVSAEASAGVPMELYGAKNRSMSGWKNINDDRSPSGVDMLISTDSVTLRGNRSNQSYGMVYHAVNLDLNTFNILKITVQSVTHHWYMILINPDLNKGFVRVQPDSNLTGTFYYDLKDITGLSGVKNMRLQVGVSTHEEKPSVLGESMTLKEAAVISPSMVPSSEKVLKKKDLKFLQRIQAAVPRKIRVLKEPQPIAVIAKKIQTAEKFSPPLADEVYGNPITEAGLEYDRLFTEGHAYRNPGNDSAPLAVKFTESGDALTVQNSFYKLALSKKNGAVLSLSQAKSTMTLVTGNPEGALWKMDTLDRKAIESKDSAFAWKWEAGANELILDYENKETASKVRATFRFDRSETFEVESEISNASDKTFTSFQLPYGLIFPVSRLDSVVLPRLVGVAFKPGFFASKRQWSDAYPSAFSDFAWIGTRSGALSVYMVSPRNHFQPATMEIGGTDTGLEGFYSHRLPIHIVSGKIWKSPKIRLAVGGAAFETIRQYAKDTGAADFPTLRERLKPQFYEALKRSPFIKVDQSVNVDIPSVIKFLPELPTPSIFHISAFWPGSFDHNYPDYLPPEPEYGTTEDFKTLIARSRERGMLAMPYTNPTWWNNGPTVKKLTEEKIAVRTLDGAILREKYNENPGIVVQPHEPLVIERNLQVLKDFTEKIPMDMLFHDQVGARRWIFMGNSPDPLSFTQGLINEVAAESQKLPLMTEGGFDRIIPYEIGFCGMTSLSFPGYTEYDRLWGKANWEIYPISLFLAHHKVNFYQHNLSDDSLSDSDAKIAWNLAYGFGLTVSRTYIRQNLEKKWIALAAAIHRHLMPSILGEELKGYLKLNERATWSHFGDVDVFVNHSDEEAMSMGPNTLAPSGFLIQSRTKDDKGEFLTAGYLTRVNGKSLDERHLLIIKTGDKAVTVIQPDAKTTFLSLARPVSWKNDWSIRAYEIQGSKETEVPVSVETGLLTILYQADKNPDAYVVRYSPTEEPAALGLEARKPGKDVLVRVIVSNPSETLMTDLKVTAAGWRVGSQNLPPSGTAVFPGPAVLNAGVLNAGGRIAAEFSIPVSAAQILDGRFVWIRVKAEYKAKGRAHVQTLERGLGLDNLQ